MKAGARLVTDVLVIAALGMRPARTHSVVLSASTIRDVDTALGYLIQKTTSRLWQKLR